MTLIDVLDLPQLYTKPTADVLLKALALLVADPPSWDVRNNAEDGLEDWPQVDPGGATRYLTSIVSSSLRWIEDNETKEEIWTQASLRLSERSGRTAMGAMSRKFRIPSPSGSFELSIHEPALTGDDLGLKTWAASYLLAKRLSTFDLIPKDIQNRPQVLELGSGTGLVGLAMASLGADVVLTDLPSICPNLSRNAKENSAVTRRNCGSARTAVLDWARPTSCTAYSTDALASVDERITIKFPLILAADSLYSPEHPRMLVDTIKLWLSEVKDAKVIVEFPYRDAYLPEIKDFRQRMIEIGLRVLEEGEENGYDDWGRLGAKRDLDDDDNALVTCWWSCWGRQISHSN